MPLVFTGYQTRSTRFQQELEAAPGEVLGATARQTITELPIPSLFRMAELGEAELTSERLDATGARQRIKDAGVEGRLTVPDEGITSAALDILIDRKRDEIKRQEVLSRSPGGFGMGAAQLGTAFATSLLDPLNVGLAFVPVVSQARYLRYLANARGAIGRTAVRAGVGAAEGAAGAAIVEPVISLAKSQEQADYDFQDSLLNIAFGTVFGGGLHTVAGGMAASARGAMGKRQTWEGLEGLIDDADVTLVQNFRDEIARGRLTDASDVDRVLSTWSPQARRTVKDVLPSIDSAAARVADMPPQIRENTLRTAMAQAMRGKAVDVETVAPKRQIDTSEFKQWFGESKVVDDAGQPMRVYHGTASEMDAFDVEGLSGVNFKQGEGFVFFTDKPDAYPSSASDYAKQAAGNRQGANIIPAFVKLEKPLTINADGYYNAVAAFDKQVEKIREQVKTGDYDGVIVRYSDGSGDQLIAVTRPEQIKSAIGNSGSFDSNSTSLTDAYAAAERQASPESEITADVRASQSANEQLAEIKIGTDEIAVQERLLADELIDLNDVARIAGIDLKEELAEFDEALELAETYGKAARAAVLCGAGH